MARLALGGGTPRSSESAVLALLRASLALLGTTFVLVALLYSGYLNYTDLDGPEVEVAEESFEVSETGRELRYGRSHLTRDGKIWRLQLQGSPEQIGDARGRLTARLFEQLDRQVQARIDERYGAWLEGWTASMLDALGLSRRRSAARRPLSPRAGGDGRGDARGPDRARERVPPAVPLPGVRQPGRAARRRGDRGGCVRARAQEAAAASPATCWSGARCGSTSSTTPSPIGS